jgi:hypothetical protein
MRVKMLKETAEELGLTPFIRDYSAPSRYIGPSFYFHLRNDDDPPIYAQVLDEMAEKNLALKPADS